MAHGTFTTTTGVASTPVVVLAADTVDRALLVIVSAQVYLGFSSLTCVFAPPAGPPVAFVLPAGTDLWAYSDYPARVVQVVASPAPAFPTGFTGTFS